MQLTVIMAQILSLISLVFLAFLARTYIQTAGSQAEEDTGSRPTTTYDEWYQSGMDSYTKEDWDDTIYYFEKALEEFKFYRSSLVACRQKCCNVTRKTAPSSKEGPVAEMLYFQGLFMKAKCVRKCKFDKLGNRPEVIDNDVTDKFLSKMPYSYLQFAYYKNFDYEKAVSAAHTYVQWNPNDEVMQNNLDYYRNLHGITEEHLIDLEEQLHHKYFMEGYKAYERGKFGAVVDKMEKALEYYWIADEECRALCEGKYENREFMDLYEAMSNHYASVLFCKSQCEEWNSRMKGGVMENYLPNHYHFLQYAYYKEGKLKEAVNSAAAFLVLVPNDPTMTTNMEYYEEDEGVDRDTVQAPPVVQSYQDRKDTELKMLQFARLHFWGEEEQEYLEEVYRSNIKSMVYQDQAEPINPDEVVLGYVQSGHSYADGLDDDPPEVTTRPQEVWADFSDEEEEEDDEIQHFPETYFEKPEEIWPEDEEFEMLEEEEEEDGPGKEYSPEPRVIYSMEDALRDMAADADKNSRAKTSSGRTTDNNGDKKEALDDVAGQSQHQEQAQQPDDSNTKRSLNSGEAESKLTERKDDFVDPNLGYRVDDQGVKWPSINLEEKTVDKDVSDTRNECRDAAGNLITKTSSCESGKSQRSKWTATSGSTSTESDVEGVSALDGLKKSQHEQNLFPSGPPRDGPSIQGRRYAGEMEVESEVEEPTYTPSLDGVKLYMNAGMLNGTKRVAADNIATQMECDNLITLMDIEAKMGDGYNGKVYPHTKYESFEGITVSVAVNAAKVGRVPLVLPATYMHLAEKSRVFMKKYFGIKKELYFSFSHLVCRTAEPDSRESRTDLSHPIHADNCQLDKARVCHKTPPAFTWRDWSAVLYLNDNFRGGDFVFAHSNFTFQSQLRPKCGRLVGFSAGVENLHGVKAVLSGRRCALALWFTENPSYQEQEFGKAATTFRATWEEQEAIKKQRATAKMEL